jgi:hypothetical protein
VPPPAPDLDAWLPRAVVRTHHRSSAVAPPDVLWRAAQQIRLADTHTLGRLVRWRIPGTPAARTYHALFRAYPFTVLDEGDAHLVSGLCGRIWTLERDYPRLDGPAEFASWRQRGTVRVLFAHWVTPAGDGRAELFSEARVEPVDRQSALRLRVLWSVIGHFEPLVGAEPLRLAARRAERGCLCPRTKSAG